MLANYQKNKKATLRHKLRNVKTGNYPPLQTLKMMSLSLVFMAVLRWPGGAIDNKNRLVIPSNRYPSDNKSMVCYTE